MRVVPMLTALILVLAGAACGGGGGPSDLGLTSTLPALPTTSAVPTSTSAPETPTGPVTQAARAEFSRLAVYDRPDAPAPSHVLGQTWRLPGMRGTEFPQVLLVVGTRPDGWIHVLLPGTPRARDGWVRAFDVRLNLVPYRIHIDRGEQRMTVLDRGRVIYRGPVAVGAASRAIRPGHYYLRWVVPSPRSRMTTSPYGYDLVPQLSSRLPLGTPVDVA